MEPERDSSGRFAPGNRESRGGHKRDKRLKAWETAQRLVADMKHPYCEDELNPVSALLYLYMTGLLPRVTEEQIKGCDQLPTADQRILARAHFMLTSEQRLECLKVATNYLMPKLTSTEIKGAVASFSTTAELGRDNPKVRAAVEHLAIVMAVKRQDSDIGIARNRRAHPTPGVE